MRHFYQKVFELRFIRPINKPTRICKSSATIIDNIPINCVFDNILKKAITKSNISDYVPIIFIIQTGKNKKNDKFLLRIKYN